MALLQRVPGSVATPKFSLSLVSVKELFKGLVTPKHEPVLPDTNNQQILPTPSNSSFASSTITIRGEVFINGHKAFELSGQCYVLSTMIVPAEHMQRWTTQIKDRLRDELKHGVRFEACHPEFHMVRDKNGRIGPCILLSCWNDATCHTESGREDTRKKMQKRVKKLQSLKDCQYPCKVVVDDIRPLARLLLPTNVASAHIFARISGTLGTYVSLSIGDHESADQECSIGGLVRVGSRIFALTVSHAFLRDEVHQVQPTTVYGDLSESESDGDSDTDASLFHEHNSDRMSIFTTKSRISTELSRTDSRMSKTTLDDQTVLDAEYDGNELDEQSSILRVGQLYATCSTKDTDLDWALIELASDAPRLDNTYVDPQTRKSTPIQYSEDVAGAPGTEVSVLAGKSGVQSGTLGQNNIDLAIRGRQYVATQIIMSQTLGKSCPCVSNSKNLIWIKVPGDSGSWVLRGPHVIGCIIAGRTMLPVAYMIPMAMIFDDISQTFDKKPVSINITFTDELFSSIGSESTCEGDPDNYKSTVTFGDVLDTMKSESEADHDATVSSPAKSVPKPSTGNTNSQHPMSYLTHKFPFPPRMPATISPSGGLYASHPGYSSEQCGSPHRLSRDNHTSMITTGFQYIAWIAVSVSVGLDFALLPSLVPQISKTMGSWFWSPLYGVAYLFAAMISTMLWRSGKPEQLVGFGIAYLIFSIGSLMTVLQYGSTLSTGSALIVWRAMAGFGAMRLINHPCRSIERWTESLKFLSLGLGAVLGALLASLSDKLSPSVLVGFFVGTFSILSMLWPLGLYFWPRRVTKSILAARGFIDKHEKYAAIQSGEDTLHSDFRNEVYSGRYPSYYSWFSALPLITMEWVIVSRSDYFNLPSGWHRPTLNGVCRLAFLLTLLSGSVLLFVTMFLRHSQLAIIAVTSATLCLAGFLGIYCWTCNIRELRLMTSWLPLMKRDEPQDFRWLPILSLGLFTISQALAGAASARYVYCKPSQ
jgi:hypothetical protein